MSATDDWTEVNIAAPLPLDVAGTLLSLIGAAYPSCVINTAGAKDRWSDRPEYALQLRIDPTERAKRVTKKQAAELVDDASDVDVLGFDDGWLSTATPDELGLALGGIAHAMFTATDGAINYVEWQVHTKDKDHRYVLSVAKSKGQTPHAMLTAAKERLTALAEKWEADAESDRAYAADLSGDRRQPYLETAKVCDRHVADLRAALDGPA